VERFVTKVRVYLSSLDAVPPISSLFHSFSWPCLAYTDSLPCPGFPAFIKALVEIGFLDASPKEWLKDGSQLTWKQILGKLVGVESGSEADIIKKIKALTTFSSSAEEERIISGFRWIGLFSDERAKVKGASLSSLSLYLLICVIIY
jgi:hypothetical protein